MEAISTGSLGIENPTSSHDPIHDKTDQGRFFSYMSHILDDSSRLSLVDFERVRQQLPGAKHTRRYHPGISGSARTAGDF